jgi:hypothetical protein
LETYLAATEAAPESLRRGNMRKILLSMAVLFSMAATLQAQSAKDQAWVSSKNASRRTASRNQLRAGSTLDTALVTSPALCITPTFVSRITSGSVNCEKCSKEAHRTLVSEGPRSGPSGRTAPQRDFCLPCTKPLSSDAGMLVLMAPFARSACPPFRWSGCPFFPATELTR